LSAQVVDLRQFAADRRYLRLIHEIDLAKISGAHLFVSLVMDPGIPLEWLSTLHWKVTHLQSGRWARVGGNDCRPQVSLLPAEAGDVFVEIKPIFPALGEISIHEHFRIDLWTPTAGHRFFLISPCPHDNCCDSPPKQSAQQLRRFGRPARKSLAPVKYLSVVH